MARLTLAENLAAPVVRFASKKLEKSQRLDLVSKKAATALRSSLRRRLALVGQQVIHAERELIDWFQGSSSARISPRVLGLLERYPGLANLWTVQVGWWQQDIADFLKHASDFQKHQDRCGRKVGTIATIVPDRSDPHSQGRSVMQVRFSDGSEWFYKPRTGSYETAWFRLLRWLNQEGFPLPFRILKMKSGRDHCWMEAVRPVPWATRGEERCLWFRAGALSYLVHLLRGVDFHGENLILNRDQPVFVDLEALLHPDTPLPAGFQDEDRSIIRTGLLPSRSGRTASHSGFAKLEKSSRAKSSERSSAMVELVDHLVRGFETMHAFLSARARRKHYLRRLAAHLAGRPGRFIYRPTRQYVGALWQSFAPIFLRHEMERSMFLLTFCTRDGGPIWQSVAEYHALENADIPVFRSLRGRPRLDFRRKTVLDSTSLIRERLSLRSDRSHLSSD